MIILFSPTKKKSVSMPLLELFGPSGGRSGLGDLSLCLSLIKIKFLSIRYLSVFLKYYSVNFKVLKDTLKNFLFLISKFDT